jgi:putative membrane-bound dehydrogenase-like protein
MNRNSCPCWAACALAVFAVWTVLLGRPDDKTSVEVPRAHDRRLVVERFAASPDIVHPIGLDFDSRGRLLVIESHTHFRPANYKGPKFDRIRVLEDTDGDGKADRFSTFYEGTRATMDIACHPVDGSVYLATRNEVLRLRDTRGTGKADECRRIVFLDTKGDYPHNGLSGLCFDSKGNLYFGLGENLGADYKLVGADGTTLTGGGEGGSIFWCTADGRKLRRVATGFWNPFGVGRDIFGRTFAVDNDPDAMPPCRLVHVVEGGDYGYQFRYGRSGRHPFQSWDGQLPGTLPMVSGTGEAPCEVLSYESDGLPPEYRGSLLVTSWADHRVERYALEGHGASVKAKRLPFVQGGKDFRPVGLALAPDGSLFVSDWVRSDYTLHGQGAVWHIRWREAGKPDRPKESCPALLSAHRPLREAAARRLTADEPGRDFLRKLLDIRDSRDSRDSRDVRTRAASLQALLDAGDQKLDLAAIADKDPVTEIRAMAVRALAGRGQDARRFLDSRQPPLVRLEAVAALKSKSDLPRLLKLIADADPFLGNAAVQQLARSPGLLDAIDVRSLGVPMQRIGVLLAWRASGRPESARQVRDFLADADEEVRFLAAKWVADEKLTEYRPLLVKALADRRLNVRLYFAYSSALARVDGKDVSEAKMVDYFLPLVTDARSPTALRVLALQMVPATDARLKVDLLSGLLARGEPALQLEAARALSDVSAPGRYPVLLAAARNPKLAQDVRAQAILGLSGQAREHLEPLLAFVRGDNATLRDEALRALTGTEMNADRRAVLEGVARDRPEAAALVARVLGKPFTGGRPPARDLDAWMKRLAGPSSDAATTAAVAAGRRVFFHPRLAGCYRCHRVEGRGNEVGPDLSTVGRNEPRHILESILQPSATVAPHYQVWHIETADGKVHTGMLVKTVLDEYTYLDVKGNLFKLNTRHIVESRPVPTSIMPDGLADLLTDQELRDLFAYLRSRR